jgi:hypothetical protein
MSSAAKKLVDWPHPVPRKLPDWAKPVAPRRRITEEIERVMDTATVSSTPVFLLREVEKLSKQIDALREEQRRMLDLANIAEELELSPSSGVGPRTESDSAPTYKLPPPSTEEVTSVRPVGWAREFAATINGTPRVYETRYRGEPRVEHVSSRDDLKPKKR